MRNEKTCLNETETALSARTAGPALACTLTSTFLFFHESFRIRASVQQQVQLSTAHSPPEEPVQQREKENKNGGGAVAMSRKIQWHPHKPVKKSEHFC